MAVLATDNFNRASLGANWTTATGCTTGAIAGSTVYECNGDPDGNRYNAVAWPNDQYSQAKLITLDDEAGRGVGPMIRQASAADTRYLYIGGSIDSVLYKTVAGTYTQLGSTGAAAAANDVLYLEAQGSAIQAKKNGANTIGTTDTAIASGNAGLYGSYLAGSSFPTCDDWEGGDFVSAATVKQLAALGVG